jgi:hypothetical protein
MKRRVIFNWLFLMLAIFVVGIFISSGSIFASGSLLSHNGVIEDNPEWQYHEITTTTAQYLILKSSSSALTSPEIDLSACSSSKLTFLSRTYGGISYVPATSSNIHLYVLIDSVEEFLEVSTPLTNSLSDNNFEIDLSVYCGKSIKLIFKSLNATSSRGFGIDDIALDVVLPPENKLPTAIPKISKLGEVVEEDTFTLDDDIFFDGSQSSDEDGEISAWWWDFLDNLPAGWDSSTVSKINIPTTTQKFNSTGTKNILFWTVDNVGASSSLVNLSLNIIETVVTLTATTTPPTTTPPIIIPTTTPVIINSGDIVINELYPAPNTGEKEWIELLNKTDKVIDLTGLFLLNLEGGKFSTTTLSGVINPGEYLILETFSGSLNNAGDTVVLTDGIKTINETSYGDFSSKKGLAWARKSDGTYSETITPTRGLVNVITPKPSATSGTTVTRQTEPTIVSTETTTTVTTTEQLIVSSSEELIVENSNVNLQGKIIINEVFPDPVGSDEEHEFIELKNISSEIVDLTDCYLTDNTKSKYIFKVANREKNSLAPGEILVIKRTESKIALNNTGMEVVNLFDPSGELLDSISYTGKKIEGKSYSRNENGEWLWSNTPTPGEANIFDVDAEKEELKAVVSAVKTAASKAKATTKASTKNYGLVEIKELKNIPDGAKVSVRGKVSVVPGILGVQVFYLAGSGIQIYSYNKYFPQLKVGELIEVSGELTTSATGRRIKTTALEDIKIIEVGEPPKPQAVTIDEIGEDQVGWLVEVSGVVLEIKGRSIFLSGEEKELDVYLKTHIDLKGLGIGEGDQVKITGILIKNQQSYRLLPRDKEDFLVLENNNNEGIVKGGFEKSRPTVDFNNKNYYWLILLAVIILVTAWWYKYRKK